MFDCQSSNGLTVFETFVSQRIISLIFFKNGLFGADCNLYFPDRDPAEETAKFGRDKKNTQRLKRDLSPTFFLCRVLEI